MKRKTLLLLAAAALLALPSCGKPDIPEPKPIDNPTPAPDPTPDPDPGKQGTDDENTIAGVTLLEGNDAVGRITDSKSGLGIEGVAVSDGYSVVKTDAAGVYQFKLAPRARSVYYSVPAEYEIPVDEATNTPLFFSRDITPGKRSRNDFTLTPLAAPENDFTLIMIGDPQCQNASHLSRYTGETIKDISSYAASLASPYAVTLGDIVWNATSMWGSMRDAQSNVQAGGRKIPFFNCIGNHDHTATASLVSNYDNDESLMFSPTDRNGDYISTADFVATFGPTDYSFNRGQAHIVVMDDVACYGLARKKSLPDGYTCDYSGGLSDEQLDWLKQDLAMVPDKGNKLVVFCCHIPFRLSAGVDGYKNFYNVLTLLKEFNEAHIMDAHTHYSQNHIHSDFVCKGGQPVYEHVHGAACGAFWKSDSSKTGSPNGYNVYHVSGNSVSSWLCKGANRDEGYQMRIYDGNKSWGAEPGLQHNYICYWYNTKNSVGTGPDTAKGYSAFKNSFVAEIWDDDRLNWKLEFWQDGVKKGDFTRVPEKACCNVAITSFYYNLIGMDSDAYASKVGTHYWYYTPTSGDPSSEKNWEARAIVTFPGSGQTRTYSCTRLTGDYSEY